jgi:hypothetical protein
MGLVSKENDMPNCTFVPHRDITPQEHILLAATNDAAYWDIRRKLEGVVAKADISGITVYLRLIFPEYTEVLVPDSANDFAYGIWRMVHRQDEIGRIPMSELSLRIKRAANVPLYSEVCSNRIH